MDFGGMVLDTNSYVDESLSALGGRHSLGHLSKRKTWKKRDFADLFQDIHNGNWFWDNTYRNNKDVGYSFIYMTL
jgi:hypothetical protein